MIWDEAPHNAFTDLIRWKERWYCAFREGSAHSSYDGATRILSSEDGKSLQSVARFDEQGHDLRDPKLCILPNGQLLVGMGVRQQIGDNSNQWKTHTRVYLTKDGTQWDGPHPIGDQQVWMWRYVTHGEFIYNFGYRQRSKGQGGETFLRFYRSRDGLTWTRLVETEAGGGYVNEAAFVFEPDNRCVVLLRREGGLNRLGLGYPPYTEWTWTDLKERFNGPALLRLPDGRILAAGRSKALGAEVGKDGVRRIDHGFPGAPPALVVSVRARNRLPRSRFPRGAALGQLLLQSDGEMCHLLRGHRGRLSQEINPWEFMRVSNRDLFSPSSPFKPLVSIPLLTFGFAYAHKSAGRSRTGVLQNAAILSRSPITLAQRGYSNKTLRPSRHLLTPQFLVSASTSNVSPLVLALWRS